MTTFAVGDRVRVGYFFGSQTHEGTVVAVRSPGRLFDVIGEGIPPVSSVTPGAGTFHAGRMWRVFSEGDKVVAVETNHGLGIRAGVVYTVVGTHDDHHGTILNVESSSGRRAWADAKRFKQYVPKPQQFELRYGDKVKNLHTGRVGQVFRNSRGELYVYDTVRPIRDGVPAAALECYEDEYPGTYDIVFRRDSEEPW